MWSIKNYNIKRHFNERNENIERVNLYFILWENVEFPFSEKYTYTTIKVLFCFAVTINTSHNASVIQLVISKQQMTGMTGNLILEDFLCHRKAHRYNKKE